MTDFFLTLPIATIIILMVILFLTGKAILSRKSLSVIIDNLKGLALTVLFAGVLVYFYGYWKFYDQELNFVALTLRSFLSSIGMFALQSDLQYFVQESVKNEPIFLGAFAVVHFLAALVSAIFIINLVGTKLISWLKMRRSKGQDLYIFWGLNENAITLAEDIYNSKVKADGGMIIFVATPQDAETGTQSVSVAALINGRSLRKERIRRIEHIDAIVTYCSDELSLEETSSNSCNIFKGAGLKSLSATISKSKDKDVRIFFLSDDQRQNLELTSMLLKAIEQKDEALNGCQHLDIYCRARKNKENGVLEKQAYIKSEETLPNVHLIDSANLAVQLLKKNVDDQPVSFVKPHTETATVDNSFTALVIGFGETGRDTVRFLYEFGAFPNSQGQRSPFKCYAIDQQMDLLSGTFCNNAPALIGKPEIELLQMALQSEQFWKWMDNQINSLNYIVISCGDDEIGAQLAIDLLEKAHRFKSSMDNFKIFIRSYSKEKENRLKEIANFYNQKTSNYLVVFGKQKDLFTYDNIIDEEAVKHAKEFYAGYAPKDKQAPTWEERHIISGKKREDITLNDINAVIRKENQDIANYRHIDTKLRLVGLSRNSAKEDFDKLSAEQKKNLAICEHLRWNASHEMLGYIYGEATSDLYKTHNCLKPWQELSPNYQKSDYDVIDTTIDIIMNSYKP